MFEQVIIGNRHHHLPFLQGKRRSQDSPATIFPPARAAGQWLKRTTHANLAAILRRYGHKDVSCPNHDEDCKWGWERQMVPMYIPFPSSMKQATLITHTTSIINCDHNTLYSQFHRTFHVPIYPCDTQCSEGVDKLDREEIDDQ